MATNYHNPKTGKTVEAPNRKEALEKMAEKPKRVPKYKKKEEIE